MGALEDDDEDVYHRDSMSRYDTVLGGEEPGDGLYGWTAPQQYTKKRGDASWRRVTFTFCSRCFNHIPFLFTDKSKDASYLGKILEGFTLGQNPAEEKTVSVFGMC